MSGRADSETHPDIAGAHALSEADGGPAAGGAEEAEAGPRDTVEVARRARWTATGAGVLLTLAGLAASALRFSGSAPLPVPAAYGVGAVVCASAAFTGHRGHTRRALWLLIAGVMVMALGDRSD